MFSPDESHRLTKLVWDCLKGDSDSPDAEVSKSEFHSKLSSLGMGSASIAGCYAEIGKNSDREAVNSDELHKWIKRTGINSILDCLHLTKSAASHPDCAQVILVALKFFLKTKEMQTDSVQRGQRRHSEESQGTLRLIASGGGSLEENLKGDSMGDRRKLSQLWSRLEPSYKSITVIFPRIADLKAKLGGNTQELPPVTDFPKNLKAFKANIQKIQSGFQEAKQIEDRILRILESDGFTKLLVQTKIQDSSLSPHKKIRPPPPVVHVPANVFGPAIRLEKQAGAATPPMTGVPKSFSFRPAARDVVGQGKSQAKIKVKPQSQRAMSKPKQSLMANKVKLPPSGVKRTSLAGPPKVQPKRTSATQIGTLEPHSPKTPAKVIGLHPVLNRNIAPHAIPIYSTNKPGRSKFKQGVDAVEVAQYFPQMKDKPLWHWSWMPPPPQQQAQHEGADHQHAHPNTPPRHVGHPQTPPNHHQPNPADPKDNSLYHSLYEGKEHRNI